MSLCHTCVRRDPAHAEVRCTVLLAQALAARQPVHQCPFYEDAEGRKPVREVPPSEAAYHG